MFFRKKKFESAAGIEYIIVGLGNPGREYETTRHNVGFVCADHLAEKHGAQIKKLKFKSLYGDCKINGVRCLLVKPQTFMNNSGEAVRDIAQFYKIPLSKVIIIFDDVSLPPGKIRIRKNGSDGGHNGMKNIIYLTANDQIPRIKIGVGEKPHPDYDLASWVLSGFSEDDVKLVKDAINKACEAVELMVNDETDKAMNLYNR